MLRMCWRCLVYSPLRGTAILKDAITAVIASSFSPVSETIFQSSIRVSISHEHVMIWKRSPHNWHFVRANRLRCIVLTKYHQSIRGIMISLVSAWTRCLANSPVTDGLRRNDAHGRIDTFKNFQIIFFNENIVFWFSCHRNVFLRVQLTIS